MLLAFYEARQGHAVEMGGETSPCRRNFLGLDQFASVRAPLKEPEPSHGYRIHSRCGAHLARPLAGWHTNPACGAAVDGGGQHLGRSPWAAEPLALPHCERCDFSAIALINISRVRVLGLCSGAMGEGCYREGCNRCLYVSCMSLHDMRVHYRHAP